MENQKNLMQKFWENVSNKDTNDYNGRDQNLQTLSHIDWIVSELEILSQIDWIVSELKKKS